MWHKAPLHPQASRVLSAMSSKAPPQCSRVVTGTCNHMFTGARRARTWDNQVEDYSTIFPQTLKKGKLQFLAYGLSWQRKLFRGGAGAEAGGEDADSSRWRYSSWQRAFLPQSGVNLFLTLLFLNLLLMLNLHSHAGAFKLSNCSLVGLIQTHPREKKIWAFDQVYLGFRSEENFPQQI